MLCIDPSMLSFWSAIRLNLFFLFTSRSESLFVWKKSSKMRGIVLGAEAIKQSSKSVWGASHSGSKSLAPLVNGRAYVITAFWRKLVGVIPSPAGHANDRYLAGRALKATKFLGGLS